MFVAGPASILDQSGPDCNGDQQICDYVVTRRQVGDRPNYQSAFQVLRVLSRERTIIQAYE